MKKCLRVFWGILTVISMIAVLNAIMHMAHLRKYAVGSCVSEEIAVRMADTAGLNRTEDGEFGAEDIGMQIVYQLAKRSIVKVVVKDSAGSGIIWKIEDGIVIASNRHLLMKDVTA